MASSHWRGSVPRRRLRPRREPVVVELFHRAGAQPLRTSRRVTCDAKTLKGRADVLELSYHVDYWYYLGWKDTFVSETTTAHQRDYALTMCERTTYTLQAVVGGRYHEVDSCHGAVDKTIRKSALEQEEALAVQLDEGEPCKLRISVAAGQIYNRRVIVCLVLFDPCHEVEIQRGENSGRALGCHNVVRDVREISEWYDKVREVMLDIEALRTVGEAVAVIVQEADSGHVLGAQKSQLAGPPRT
jgi:hypothetical protein